jgi:L,D-peptidoglycan transpeptidase YkuD (ErfK/YbiS/YcfS/YnhG family)
MHLVTLLASACLASPPATPPATTQLVTVDAPSAHSTHATVKLWELADGCWSSAGGPWPARVGRNGLSAHRSEGDGTTPTGTFPFGRTVYGVAPDPGVSYAYHRLVCGDWWDGDRRSPTYNRFRHVPCGAKPPFSGGEALWTYTRAYRHLAVIGFNAAPVVPGRGSAIFLHAATGRATAGCVSLPLARLLAVLRWLEPSAAPVISIRVG